MPENRILQPIRESLGRYILGLPIHSLRLVSLLVVQVHPHSQRDDQSECQGFNTDGDGQRFAVRRCPFVEENVGGDDTAGVRQEGLAAVQISRLATRQGGK